MIGPSRIWTNSTKPLTVPTSFSKNKDYLVTDDGKWYIYTTSWIEVKPPVPVPVNGKDGRDGIDGKNGLDGLSIKGDKGDPGEKGEKGDPGTGSSGGANVGGVRWVTTATELNSAWTEVNNGTVRSINLAANIQLTAPLVLAQNFNKILEINGHGYELSIDSSLGSIIKREYTSLSLANAGIDCSPRITNVEFVSKGTARVGNAIDLQATYGMEIKGCRFRNFKNAINLGWCMGNILDECFFWENDISINLDFARFTGGSSSASQCNHTVVSNCKFRHSAGQTCAIKATAVSGLKVSHNIFEGIQNGPLYHVWFDDASSTTVKEFLIEESHVEQQPSVASLYCRLKDGAGRINGVFSQYDCTLITLETSAYGKLYVKNIPYLTGGTKFNYIGNGARFSFHAMPPTFVAATTTNWVSGIAPSQTAESGFSSVGQAPFISLNNKKVVTA